MFQCHDDRQATSSAFADGYFVISPFICSAQDNISKALMACTFVC